MTAFRVELIYGFRRRKGVVLLGMTIAATHADEAIAQPIKGHIKPYYHRVYLQCSAKPEKG